MKNKLEVGMTGTISLENGEPVFRMRSEAASSANPGFQLFEGVGTAKFEDGEPCETWYLTKITRPQTNKAVWAEIIEGENDHNTDYVILTVDEDTWEDGEEYQIVYIPNAPE